MSTVKRNGNGRVHATHGREAGAERAHKHNGGHHGAEARARAEISSTDVSASIPTEARTDEQLLLGYQQGDTPSFAKLVERYQRELFHFLVRFLGDRAAAEDVFQ